MQLHRVGRLSRRHHPNFLWLIQRVELVSTPAKPKSTYDFPCINALYSPIAAPAQFGT